MPRLAPASYRFLPGYPSLTIEAPKAAPIRLMDSKYSRRSRLRVPSSALPLKQRNITYDSHNGEPSCKRCRTGLRGDLIVTPAEPPNTKLISGRQIQHF